MNHPPDRHAPKTLLPQAPVGGDARERAVGLLKRVYADDALTEAEFESRGDLACCRALTGAELDAVVADLTLPSPASGTATATGAERIVARFSGHEARTIEVVPRQLQLRARLGYIELDLTGATFEPDLTMIDIGAFMGYVQIRLPGSVRVEDSGRAVFGNAECAIARARGGTAAGA